MKKLTAIVMTLVLALLCCVSVTASAGSTPTFVWEDCAIQLLSYKIVKIAYSSAHMDLYARVLNNKDYKISVWLENADIDGVEVTVGPIVLIDPHSDTGTEDPVSLLKKAGVVDSGGAGLIAYIIAALIIPDEP